jgi:hypothetical protein
LKPWGRPRPAAPRAPAADRPNSRSNAPQVNEFDQKKAAAALGSDSRPLTRANVEKFLGDFGLDPEFACHSNIRGLSGARLDANQRR